MGTIGRFRTEDRKFHLDFNRIDLTAPLRIDCKVKGETLVRRLLNNPNKMGQYCGTAA